MAAKSFRQKSLRTRPAHFGRAICWSNAGSSAPPFRRLSASWSASTQQCPQAENSDETGIVVCALGVDGHGYVLEDASGKFLPVDWARRAVSLYRTHAADRIVAEVNQGGAMVETTIRTIDENVSYRAVHASKGKITRAEPVSALFEQKRVHLVGVFPGTRRSTLYLRRRERVAR